jgi:putative membrane protein
MKQLIKFERYFLIGHVIAMAFGLAGLLIVLPHPELIAGLSTVGQTMFQWSMSGGGVVYILLGALAVAIYAFRTLGLWHWLTFMLPAISISLSSELLGTSTGFPFGEYSYLNGLGYKIAGLVPFTIPLSWFYLGLVSYLLARVGLEASVETGKKVSWLRHIGAITLGAILLTSWDFVLDPAMSQTTAPFWFWGKPGAFFGMPYQNFAGWLGTGAIFMSVATLLWKKAPLGLTKKQLGLPLVVYLTNFAFAAIMSIGAGIWIPIGLGIVLGVAPALILWWMASETTTASASEPVEETQATPVSVAPVGVMPE